MDSSVSPKDEIWFLRVCHHISNAVYIRGSIAGGGGKGVVVKAFNSNRHAVKFALERQKVTHKSKNAHNTGNKEHELI